MTHPSCINLGKLLTDTARRYPERIGLIHGDDAHTWRELDDHANALCAALRELGIRKGDRVLLQAPNNRHLFESPWGVIKAGAVFVSINPRSSGEELARIAADCQPSAFLVDPTLAHHVKAVQAAAPSLRHVVVMGSGAVPDRAADWLDYDSLLAQHAGASTYECEMAYDDPVWLPYTSGTTGRPKGAIQTHGQMVFVLLNRIADVLPALSPDDASLVIGPLSHGAWNIAACNMIRGAKSVIPTNPHFDEAECWALIEKYRITNLFAVPTVLSKLIRSPAMDQHDHSSLRYIQYGGAPITRVDQRLAIEKLGHVLVQGYGQAECNGTIAVLYPWMHSTRDDDPGAPAGACGVVRTGIDVAILSGNGTRVGPGETGEICVRGPAVFAGYYNNPEATREAFRDGWLRTGDLGQFDERGFLYIVGRDREMFISGGMNVYPNEVEDYLSRHPALDQVCVVSVPDTTWGEIGVAAVTLKAGHAASEAELTGFMRTQLANYKRPKRIFVVDDIPKTAVGKVSKQAVRLHLYTLGLLKDGQDVEASP